MFFSLLHPAELRGILLCPRMSYPELFGLGKEVQLKIHACI